MRASSSSVSSLSTSPSRSTPQWPCARVLAEADVGERAASSGNRGAQRAQRALDDPVVVPGAGALVVLLLRDAEQDHRRDAERARARRLARRASSTECRAQRRAAPRSASALRRDEERHHEVVEVEPRLAHERAQRVGAPQAAQRVAGKGAHGVEAYAQAPRSSAAADDAAAAAAVRSAGSTSTGTGSSLASPTARARRARRRTPRPRGRRRASAARPARPAGRRSRRPRAGRRSRAAGAAAARSPSRSARRRGPRSGG